MATIPFDSLEVGPYTYTVENDGDSEYEWYGDVNHLKQRIRLKTQQADDSAKDTLLHEVLHIIMDQSPALRDYPKQQAEEIVGMSSLLLDTLRRNPDVVMWMLNWEATEDETEGLTEVA